MPADSLAAIRRLPRIRLAHLPTPLEPMPRLGAQLGLGSLWVKRDDCTGLGIGGNKIRKLEFDPVYAGKGMAGLIGLGRQGRFRADETVVWPHTGGVPGIFAYPVTMARIAAASDQQFRNLV